MKRMRLSRLVPALVASLSVTGVVCFWPGDDEDCVAFCGYASRCGVLPSSLGADVNDVSAEQNCIGRCALTDREQRRGSITSCWDAPPPEDFRIEQAWCSADGPRACEIGAACLEAALPDSGILGVARLDVVFGRCGLPAVVREPREAGCDRPDLAKPTCEVAFSGDAVSAWCNEVQAAEVEIQIEQRGTLVAGAKGPCASILAQTTTFDALRPGPARASARIRRARDGGVGSHREDCIVFYGPERVLSSGVPTTAQIALADADAGAALSAITCEITEEECAGGGDEDKDGHIDCSDVDCQAFCDAGARTTPGPN